MLKSHRFVRQVGKLIGDASEAIVGRILNEYPHSQITGFEEDLTSQLKSEINSHLLEEIRSKLDGEEIKGVKFKAYTFKKKDEKPIGADISGFLELIVEDANGNKNKISKAYLAQAKICSIERFGDIEPRIFGSNSLILSQAREMLKITSDAFFFCYTTEGIFVVPALHVQLRGENSIDTKDLYFKKFGRFYEEFFKCFVGDHKIAEIYSSPDKLIELSKQQTIDSLLIRAEIPYLLTDPNNRVRKGYRGETRD